MKAQDSLSGVSSLGGALQRAFHNTSVEDGMADAGVKAHPGKAVTVLDLGLKTLRVRANTMNLSDDRWESVRAKAFEEYLKGETLCESPIERSMLAALITGQWSGFGTIPPRVHSALDKEEMFPKGDVVIVPQMAFLRYRMDFGVIIEAKGHPQIVCVECDGHQFHQDFRKEALRVNYFKSWGIPVFKFTGSELHEDAIASAHRMILAICQWKDAQ